MVAFYKNYGKINSEDKRLKVASDILNLLQKYKMAMIIGCTGSGKSFLLEYLTPESTYCCISNKQVNNDFFNINELLAIDGYYDSDSKPYLKQNIQKIYEQRKSNLKPTIIAIQCASDIKELSKEISLEGVLILELNDNSIDIKNNRYFLDNMLDKIEEI